MCFMKIASVFWAAASARRAASSTRPAACSARIAADSALAAAASARCAADIASAHVAAGASVWEWAGTRAESGGAPDVVLACAGDIATQETLAAAAMLRKHVPDLSFRVVNVVDMLSLATADRHPHALTPERFRELFTDAARNMGLAPQVLDEEALPVDEYYNAVSVFLRPRR